MRTTYFTATTLDGFLATDDDSLAWLFDVGGEHPDATDFMESVSALVAGSHSYEWVLQNEDLIGHPEKWATYFGDRPMFVFTSRELPVPAGADVRFLDGSVRSHLPTLEGAAGDGHLWIQGGGDLAAQFLEAGALDALVLNVAPVLLGSGRPLFTGMVPSSRLRLVDARPVGQFVVVRYDVLTQDPSVPEA